MGVCQCVFLQCFITISINKIIFEEGKKHEVYFRTLGNIVMVVPPLAISQKELNMLISRTIDTIKSSQKQLLN